MSVTRKEFQFLEIFILILGSEWYENKWIWFGLGVVFTATSVKLAGEIID